jgi:hypothetical protein
VGQSGTQMGSRGSTWSGREGPGLYTSVIDDEWEAPWWEQIIPRPIATRLPPLSTTDRRRRTRMQDKLRDQQHASRWRNKRSTQASVQTNLEHFRQGSAAHRVNLVPTILQIRATAVSLGLDTHPNKADLVWFTAAAETIYEARTQEEAMVRDLLEQWRKGGHGYVPDVKGDNTVRLGCKNANSLSLYDPWSTKLRKLLSLHNKYQMDGACIVEHGTNFLMAPVGQRLEDIFAAFWGSRSVSAAHNIHEQHSRYQQGGTLTAAFTCLSGYVTATGVDPTGLGHW